MTRTAKPARPRRSPLLALGLAGALALAAPATAMTSHAGWPPDQHLVMDKGPAGRHHVLTGRPEVHNYLLGGYGDDTIYGGAAGEVIWGDYHPSGRPAHEGSGVIHCENPHIIVFTSHHALPHYKLRGCRRISFYSVGYQERGRCWSTRGAVPQMLTVCMPWGS